MAGNIVKGLAVAGGLGPPADPGSMSNPAGDFPPDPLAQRLDEMDRRIEAIRAEMEAAIEKRLSEITKAVPAVLESIIVPRVEDLRTNLRAEIQQAINAALKKLDRVIDERVADRVETLERAVLQQSSIVTTLRHRAVETDMNVQRLIGAVERLCERAPAGPQDPSLPAPPGKARQPEVIEPQFESAFRPQILKEGKDPTKRHRIPLTKL